MAIAGFKLIMFRTSIGDMTAALESCTASDGTSISSTIGAFRVNSFVKFESALHPKLGAVGLSHQLYDQEPHSTRRCQEDGKPSTRETTSLLVDLATQETGVNIERLCAEA